MKITTTALAAMLAALMPLSGCTTTQVSKALPPQPAADLGAEFEVIKAPRYRYRIAETTDGAGRVHLIIALHDAREVCHVVIGPQSVESSELVRAGVWPETLDAAFDRAGKLHALIGDEHFVLKGGKWIGGQRTPWGDAKLSPSQFYHSLTGYAFSTSVPAFVKGMPDLTWAFAMTSDDKNWPSRIDWEGGGPNFFILPIPNPTWKLIVVPVASPYRNWNAIGMEDSMDVISSSMTGDSRGVVRVIYQASHNGGSVPDVGHLRYAVFRVTGPCSGRNLTHDSLAIGHGGKAGQASAQFTLTNGMTTCAVPGAPLAVTAPDELADIYKAMPWGNAAIDPDSGQALLIDEGVSNLIDPQSGKEVLAKMPIKDADILLAPAGKGRFHAMATSLNLGTGLVKESVQPVYYLEYADGKWSAPIEIGKSWSSLGARLERVWDNSSNRGEENGDRELDVFRVVNDNHGRALLLWPHKDALVARWVTLEKTK